MLVNATMVKQALAYWRRLKQKTMEPTMLRVDLPSVLEEFGSAVLSLF